MPDTYTDLLLRIFPLDGRTQAYPVEAELDDGSRYTGGQLKLDRDALLSLQLDSEAYGLALFDALFAGDSRRAYDKATGAAEANTGGRLRVRLWVDNDAVELHATPWERLYHLHKGKAVPLGASTLTPLSRYTSLEIREPQPVTDVPIQMLVAVSNPEGLPGGLAPANVDLEIESLRRSLDELRRTGQIKITVMPGHTGLSAALRSRLEGEGYTIADGPLTLFNLAPHLMKSHIFHFIGHGAFKKGAGGRGSGIGDQPLTPSPQPQQGTAALYLEKVDGTWQAVRDEEILTMLTALGHVPHLFFLVACESAKREAEATSPFVGLGPKLVQAGVPAVVAMQEQVPVELARTLSSEFYARLAEHGEVDRALNQARLQIFNRKSTEWAIPVLFMRIRKGRLFGADVDEDAPAPGLPPFKGLEYFNENDADKFYGREMLTAKLVGRLRNARFLPVIIGASGSGKSSVIRAGLVPALKRGETLADGAPWIEGAQLWPVYVLTPSTKPAESLAASLTREATSVKATTTLLEDVVVDPQALHRHALKLMADHPQAQRLLIIVDQFEEVFTLCKDESERRAFINNLLYASDAATDGPTTVIIIFRADFYAHCAQYANLRVAVSTNQEFVGPMNPDELRRSIEEPAKAGGWEFEPGLVDLILKEVGDEPGALPLMQHALLETWKRRRGRSMTLRGYNDVGGIRGAIAKTAEVIFKDLSVDQQTIARKIFLRLVELGEGTQDTRRRVQLEELYLRAEDQPATELVLKKLVDNRLIVTTDKTAEVAHEALIREWPLYREWINANRENLKIHRDLGDAAREWDNLLRETGLLYRGVRLVQAIEWAQENPDELNKLEAEFLAASREEVEREARELAEQQRRELEAAQRIAEEQRKRAEEQARAAQRQRVLSRVIGGVGVVAAALAVVAFVLFGQANVARSNAVAQQSTAEAASTQALAQQATAEAERTRADANADTAQKNEQAALAAQAEAETQARISSVRQLGAQAQALPRAQLDTALLLSVEAQRLAPDQLDGHAALFTNLSDASLIQHFLRGHTGRVRALAFSPDGRTLVSSADDGTARLWDVTTGQPLTQPIQADVSVLAIAPDSKYFAGMPDSPYALPTVWTVPEGQVALPPDLGPIGIVPYVVDPRNNTKVYSLAVSPTGERLAFNNAFHSFVFDYTPPDPAVLPDFTGPAPGSSATTFSPDGQALATVDFGTLRVVGPAYGDSGPSLTLESVVASLSFDAASQNLAWTDGQTVQVWNLSTGEVRLAPLPHTAPIQQVLYTSRGTLISASVDNTVLEWDEASGEVRALLSGAAQSQMDTIAVSADGTAVASAVGETIVVWQVGEAPSALGPTQMYSQPVTAVALNPIQPEHLVGLQNGLVLSIADEATSREPATRGATTTWLEADGFQSIHSLAYSSDAQHQAAGLTACSFVWGVADLAVKLCSPFRLEPPLSFALAFSPNAPSLAHARSSDGANGVDIWNLSGMSGLADPDVNKVVETFYQSFQTIASANAAVLSLAYSADGHWLAGADTVGQIWLWDTAQNQFQPDWAANHNSSVFTLAFSPIITGPLASGGADGLIKLWDVETGQQIGTLTGHAAPITRVRFALDGRLLISASRDGTLRLWDVATLRPLGRAVRAHAGGVNDFDLSADGVWLLSGGADGATRFWKLEIESLNTLACQLAGRNLTTAEWRLYFGDAPYHPTCEQWPEGE